MSQIVQSTVSRDKALTATYATSWIDVRSAYVAHLQMSSDNTGSPVGAWTIEETNDPVVEDEKRAGMVESAASVAKAINISADSSRVVVLGTGLTVNAANNTEVIVHSPARFLRLKYTRTSGGTGSLAQVWVSARE